MFENIQVLSKNKCVGATRGLQNLGHQITYYYIKKQFLWIFHKFDYILCSKSPAEIKLF